MASATGTLDAHGIAHETRRDTPGRMGTGRDDAVASAPA